MTDRAIGIFDSGLGGLSVAREIRTQLPDEKLLYFADTRNCPYGGRDLDEVRALSLTAARELGRRGVKMLVVACNTATGAALEAIRAELEIPVVGLEPAVRPAARLTVTGRVAVLATEATLRTERFRRLIDNFAGGITIFPKACPGLVELVEEGALNGEDTDRALMALLGPLLATRVDTVVLGCTHYPFLHDAIARTMGPDVLVIDSGAAVARRVSRVLDDHDIRATGTLLDAALPLVTTGDPIWVTRVAERLWGGEVRAEAV